MALLGKGIINWFWGGIPIKNLWTNIQPSMFSEDI
jgi:hypothetical protein